MPGVFNSFFKGLARRFAGRGGGAGGVGGCLGGLARRCLVVFGALGAIGGCFRGRGRRFFSGRGGAGGIGSCFIGMGRFLAGLGGAGVSSNFLNGMGRFFVGLGGAGGIGSRLGELGRRFLAGRGGVGAIGGRLGGLAGRGGAGVINGYLGALARRLHLDPQRKREILEELEAHIEDKAAELEAGGMEREAALACAVAEMGAAGAVAKRMYAVHSPVGVWRDVLLAVVPHFLLAALFALHLWSHYFLVSVVLLGIAFVTWRNWRAGGPSGWSYTWMGYTLAAPALSWLLSLMALGHGGWTLLTTGQLPFDTVFFLLLLGYVPFSMWIVFNVVAKIARRDWLLVSLTALPFPFLTSWVLFLNWSGGLWSDHAERMQQSDTARAFIFLALALTTAVFLRVGPRLLRIGLLMLATSVLVVITALSLPVDLGFVAVGLMILASVAFLLSPAVLDAQANRRGGLGAAGRRGEGGGGGWYSDTG